MADSPEAALWQRLIRDNEVALEVLGLQERVLMEMQTHYGNELQEASDTFRELRDRLQRNGEKDSRSRRRRKKEYRRLDKVSVCYLDLSKIFTAVDRQLHAVRSAMRLRLAQQREMSPVENS